MEFNIDTSKIVSLVVKHNNGNYYEYLFEDGLIVEVKQRESDPTIVNSNENEFEAWKNLRCDKEKLKTREMIDRLKNDSDFIGELNEARRRFKISKEIEEGFPERNEEGKIRRPLDKTSDESLPIINQIIKKDLNGELDEILKEKRQLIYHRLKKEFDNDENPASFEIDRCDEIIKRIKNEISDYIKKQEKYDFINDEYFKALLDGYKFYLCKKEGIIEELKNKNGSERN